MARTSACTRPLVETALPPSIREIPLRFENLLSAFFTIGLIEIPAYCYAAWKMRQLHFIRWGRELSLAATVLAGLGLGCAATFFGRLLFPNL